MFDVGGGVVEYLLLEVMLVVVVVVAGVGTGVVGVVAGVVGVAGIDPMLSAHGYLYGSHYHHIAGYPTPGRFLVSLYTGYHCFLCTLSPGFSFFYPLWVFLPL